MQSDGVSNNAYFQEYSHTNYDIHAQMHIILGGSAQVPQICSIICYHCIPKF